MILSHVLSQSFSHIVLSSSWFMASYFWVHFIFLKTPSKKDGKKKKLLTILNKKCISFLRKMICKVPTFVICPLRDAAQVAFQVLLVWEARSVKWIEIMCSLDHKQTVFCPPPCSTQPLLRRWKLIALVLHTKGFVCVWTVTKQPVSTLNSLERCHTHTHHLLEPCNCQT